MFDFVQGTLVATNLILRLAFLGLLVFLCIRTRSKGLIIITVLVIFRSTLGLISDAVIIEPFLDQWGKGKINNWLAQRMTVGEFIILYRYVTSIFYNGLLALGALLIYREWSRGKIRWTPDKSPEIVSHA